MSDLIDRINKLSNDAVYIASLQHFGVVMMGKPILLAPANPRQQKAFDELLDAGFVHGDVERGVFGYRSTFSGREAHPHCVAALAGHTE